MVGGSGHSRLDFDTPGAMCIRANRGAVPAGAAAHRPNPRSSRRPETFLVLNGQLEDSSHQRRLLRYANRKWRKTTSSRDVESPPGYYRGVAQKNCRTQNRPERYSPKNPEQRRAIYQVFMPRRCVYDANAKSSA